MNLQSESGNQVTQEQYCALLDAFQTEKLEHARTKQALMSAQDQLDFAKGEIEILKKQVAREKRQFEETYSILKKKAIEESCRNEELKSTCEEISRDREFKSVTLQVQTDRVQEMKYDMEKQKSDMMRRETEQALALQQEAYLNRLVQKSRSTNS